MTGSGAGPRPWVAGLAMVLVLTRPEAPLGAAPKRGLTSGELVASAYDAALNAEFDRMADVLQATCGPAPRVACLGVRALSTWWEILLDPQDRFLDARFLGEVGEAIDEADAWTRQEPERAEAWFYLGAAIGARGQWRILREDRLAAARDGKRIKAALEQALELDPAMHDAAFGIGVYRYYADIAPAYLRWLRWLLLLPGGNRAGGLAQMERARRDGLLVRAEAAYQLHLVYLWYEHRVADALAIDRELRDRYPRNPLFHQIEAEILDVYLHDHAASLSAWEQLLARAETGMVNRPALASVRARVNIAVELDHLGQRERARALIDPLLARGVSAPRDAVARARQLQRAWARLPR